MQHPSYTGGILVLFSTVVLLGSERGALLLVANQGRGLSPWLTVAQFAYWVGIFIYGIPIRIHDEEGC
jgi:protein-S-isoprenylcysteine O-methyltransferase Ste14